MKEFVGYHGTRLADGMKILAEGRFAPSVKDVEWLGWGVYFFEEDIDQARNWCTKVRCYAEYCIIRAEIKAEVDRILDFTKHGVWEKFLAIKGRFRNTIMMRKPQYRTKEIPDGVFVNLLADKNNIDLIRGVFITPPVEKRYKQGQIAPMQIQLCVRNQECICSLGQEA